MDKKTPPKKPLAKQLRRLYELEARIYDLDPWKWLTPADIFCVQFEGRDPLFICFHAEREHKSIDIGVGWPNYVVLLHVHTHKIHYPAFYFETRMFQCGRLDALRTFATERVNYDKYGPPNRGQRIPFFRTHNIGYTPWPVDREEAQLLCDTLYAAFGMALRLEDFREPIGHRAMDAVYTISISASGAMSDPQWVPLPKIQDGIQADVNLSGDLLQRVRDLPEAPLPMEIEHVFLPVLFEQRRTTTPPETAYLFLTAGGRYAFIGANLVLHARGNLANVWTQLPGRLLQVFLSQHMRPPEIQVTDSRLISVLRPLTELLPIKITRAERLPIIERDSPPIIKKLTGENTLS